MLTTVHSRQVRGALALCFVLAMLISPALGEPRSRVRKAARSQFEEAQRMREALNGSPSRERTRREYHRVMDAYRRVYYVSPASSKADAAIVAVAELLAEMGRALHDDKSLRSAIGQYEFLRREYPGSKYRFDALFTIGQIYREDLEENDKARETFQEFIRRYPRHQLAADARDSLKEMDQELAASRRGKKPESARARREAELKPAEAPVERRTATPLVTGIRHWATPDYTRVAIDLEEEVKYEAGRVPDPDRIFFDLHNTKLASTLVGKTFDVSDGFLRRIRVAQFQKGLSRVVLEVDDVSDYSAFLLPNPYRLIIDIHGRKPGTMVARNEQKSPDAKPSIAPPSAPAPQPKIEEKKQSTVAKLEPPKDTSPEPRRSIETPRGEEENPRLHPPAQKPISTDEGASTKEEVANLKGPELKATESPTSEPTVQVVAPRAPEKRSVKTAKKKTYPEIHSARPSSNGERSLIRALGLKIGKIVVDAGHGGHDTGTIGPSGLLEKDLVLDVAMRLRRLLEGRMGADVVLTRDDDTFIPLETRTGIANKHQADLFISIHANSSQDASARGLETYYLNFTSSADALEVAARENAVSEKSIHELQDLVKKIAMKEKIEESREFANDVQRSMVQTLTLKDKGLRDRGVKKAPFIVLIGANMPSILAEISFVSNPSDERRLQSPEYRQKIADALYKGVQRYVGGLSGIKLASASKQPADGQ